MIRIPRWRRATWIVVINLAIWALLLGWWLIGVQWQMPPNVRDSDEGALAELVMNIGLVVALVLVLATLVYWVWSRPKTQL